MSSSIRFVAAVGLVVGLAACDATPQEEFVVAEPVPITIEPTYNGKYK